MTEPIDLARKAIYALFGPDDVVELRVLGSRNGRKGIVAAGYYSDRELLAKAVINCSDNPPKGYTVEGIYYLLNPATPDLMARYANRMQRDAMLTTNDREIVCRKLFLIDCDPARPAGISSSDAEKQKANEKAAAIKQHLTDRGWPLPIECDSGNGAHLLYRLNSLPNDDKTRDLIKACLVALAARFDDASVKIDQSVFNSSRITKSYGSVARKGDNYGQRPHRRSRMLVNPNAGCVELQLLQSLASEAPLPEITESNLEVTPEKFEEQLTAVGLEFDECQMYSGGYRWHLSHCVFDPSHVRTSVIIGIRSGGAFYYHCSHSSCSGLTWKHFREQVEKVTGKRMKFRDQSVETPDSLVLLRLKADKQAWDAYNANLETWAGDAEKAYQYLLQAFKRCGVTDPKQFARVFRASSLLPLYEATIPDHLR